MKLGLITKMVKANIAKLKTLGGVVENRFISPKGLYSKPKGDEALIIHLGKNSNLDIVLALQKEKSLQDGDVMLTDDKSYIHLKYSNGSIKIKGKTTFLDEVVFEKGAKSNANIEAVEFIDKKGNLTNRT